MADPSRAAVLIELTDGRALPPSELAEVAGVSRSTISEHLAKLQRAGFLTVEKGGRNRYFRLAGPEIATAVESLAALAPRFPVRSLKQSRRAGALGARSHLLRPPRRPPRGRHHRGDARAWPDRP